MRNGDNQAVEAPHVLHGNEPHAVGALRLGGIGPWVGDHRLDAVLLEPLQDVLHLGVAHIRAVLLEGDAEHAHAGIGGREPRPHHLADGGVGNELAHPVVDLAAGEDDLGVVSKLLRLIGEVVGIDADAVAADEARPEAEGVPLGVHTVDHLGGVDAHAVEDHGELVHEGDVDVTLGVLDDLDRLGGLDGGDGVGACRDHDVIDVLYLLEGLDIHAGDDLSDGRERVHAVTGIDALRRVADLEVHATFEPRLLLKDGYAHVLGDAGVDGRLVDDDGAGLEMLTEGPGGPFHRREVRRLVLVHRRRHGHDVEARLLELGRVGGELDRRPRDRRVADLVSWVNAGLVFLNFCLVEVVADDLQVLGELDGDGHAHVAEADEGELGSASE